MGGHAVEKSDSEKNATFRENKFPLLFASELSIHYGDK